MTTRNHYGITVHSDTPITGVFNYSPLSEEYFDALTNNAVDETVRTLVFPDTEDGEEYTERAGIMYLGYTLDSTGTLSPDTNAVFSAIDRPDPPTVQVTHSQYAIRCALCSPCYPGQGDADTPGEYIAYSLPPDMIEDKTLRDRVFEITFNSETEEETTNPC